MPEYDAMIVTHGDVDGMVCAAQLIRHEGQGCGLVFSNARYVQHAIRRLTQLPRKPARLYVCDIPACMEVEVILSSLSVAGTQIFWIDHHPWPEGVKEAIQQYCRLVIHNESLSTPAGVLTAQWLKETDTYFEAIGRICYASAKGTEWERNWFKLLSSYVGNGHREVLERLAYNLVFTEDDLLRIRQKELDEQSASEILARPPQIVTAANGWRIAIYDTSDGRGIYLGRKVFNHHNVDYCLIRISGTKWQLASNPVRRHDMSRLIGTHSLDGSRILAGGRGRALLSLEVVTTDGVHIGADKIIGWVAERL
jgi:hypothetical protein